MVIDRRGGRIARIGLPILAAIVLLGALSAAAGPSASARRHAAPKSWFPFAPFVDMAEYPPPKLAASRAASGTRHISLGFITAKGGTSCNPTWGGYAEYPGGGAHPYRLADVRALRRAGGDVVVSFGGAAGTELASACGSVAALKGAYGRAISAYHATHVDFDIEGATLGQTAATKRRSKAIAKLQRAARSHGKRLRVSFTLPVEPSGLSADGRALVRSAAGAGVSVSVVNGMAMDYGDPAAPHPAGKMGSLAIGVARAMARQLGGIFPKLGSAAIHRRIGITPMIGINDVPSEVFTLSDARKLAAYARSKHLGMLSMWQLGRDSQCATPTTVTQNGCSGVRQKRWAFSKALGRFRG